VRYDFVIIGAGPAGEAAAFLARDRGATVAVVERDLVGGSCPHWGCVPSKSLLHGASRHALGAGYPWQRASDRRDWMINRVGRAYPDDGGHVTRLEAAGAEVFRGEGRLDGPGRVAVAGAQGAGERVLEAASVIVATGSRTRRPPVEGIDGVRTWTNREATGARELPASLLVLGGGPTGVELAQVYARFGVPVTVVQSGPRLIPTDHPRNSEAARLALTRDGADVRLGVRARAAIAAARPEDPDLIKLDDGTTAAGHAILLAVGRDALAGGVGLESVGVDPASIVRDGRVRIADGVYLAGDPAGPELHTHQAHYQGELAVRMAMGEPVTPDYRALPRATYTDPELASVGMTPEEARRAGIDAFEVTAELATTARGYSVEADFGHVSLTVDRASRELVGAAIAAPDASAAIHECVLAIRARVAMDVLADTIHAFPSTSRILNGLFADALRLLGDPGR
jgi:pyruvate/2-oxoglutarate dehydrogenase complex dihydrolipoamide dehydrogenase (E3) component